MSDAKCDEFDRLLNRHFDGSLSAEEGNRLARLLADGGDRPRRFARAAMLHYQLCSLLKCDRAVTRRIAGSKSASQIVTRRRNIWLLGGMLAATLLALIAVPVYRYLNNPAAAGERTPPAPRLAKVISSTDALWGDQSIPDSEGWLPAGSVHLRSGQIEIQFESSNAVIALRAPAEFEAISPTEAKLVRGTMSARVDGSSTSFLIHTPSAEVVDLGTAFGLAVDGYGETDVAVFDGAVNVSSGMSPRNVKGKGSRNRAPQKLTKQLTAGEALRVDHQGQFHRIATISDDSFPILAHREEQEPARAPLIAELSDNLREYDSPKFYRIVTGGFGEDALAYVDRNYEWNGIDESGIPEFLIGADYIMPFNDDKSRDLEIRLTLARPSSVFVLFDDRGVDGQGTPPKWLEQTFTYTGLNVGMDEAAMSVVDPEAPSTLRQICRGCKLGRGPGVSIDREFSIWRRDLNEPGVVVLGPRGGSRTIGRSMYGIVLIPLEGG